MAEEAPIKILLVDDEPDFVELTSTMLGFYDYAVDTFSDPLVVEEALKNTQYSIIVTDLMMPGMDGFELISIIRGMDNYKETPIIVLSAKTLSDEERKSLLQQEATLMVKPFEPQGLVDQVQNLLQVEE